MDAVAERALVDGAAALTGGGRGVLAIDETPRTLTSRFDALGIASTPESRRDYRELLIRTPGLARFISGVILNEETLRQEAADGTAMPVLVSQCGLMPGIKVDRGVFPLAGAPGETVTEGLDGLRDRFQEFRNLGARFTKWRAVFTIGLAVPSRACIVANAHALARYAALAQEVGLVPMVEAEVLMDGEHDIDRAAQETAMALRELFAQLVVQRVLLEGLVLKPNMVASGLAAAVQASPDTVAAHTLACLRRTVPAAVPGILFLSGGQPDDQATRNLDAIARQGAATGAPWQISFSFARALQRAPLAAWGGRPDRVAAAQAVLHERASLVHDARCGQLNAAASGA